MLIDCGRAGEENIWLEVMCTLGPCGMTESQIFPVPPDLTQSIGILSYDLIFHIVQKREEGEGLVNK